MPKKVLILEDEPLIAWDIEEELAGRGWQIAGPVVDVKSATELLAADRPDVALLDVNLGGSNSYELARHCQREGVAVVFLTGESADSLPADLRHIPICAKPVGYDALARTLEKVMSRPRESGG